jgi:hypothetical protein
MTLNYCGRGHVPGTVGPGGSGNIGGRLPVILVPDPTSDPKPPLPPYVPPPIQPELRYKCVELGSPGAGLSDKKCLPCDGRPGNPNIGDPDCLYLSIEECRENCESEPEPELYKCDFTYADVCPESSGLQLSEAQIVAFHFGCRLCEPDESDCVPLEQCQQNCISPVYTGNECEQPNTPTIPQVQFPGPSQDEPETSTVVDQLISNSVAPLIEPNRLVTTVNIQNIVSEDDYQENYQNITRPKLFDKELNFFNTGAIEEITFVQNNFNSAVFKSQVPEEVAQLLLTAGTNEPWNELTLQSLTDEKLIKSLNPLLLGAFQSLRKPGGELVGLSVFLAAIRRHLLEGTMSEFDPNFYLEMYESQKEQDFAVFQEPETEEYSERFVIKFLTNQEYTFQNNKQGEWGNFMIGRMRPLNSDLNMSVDALKLNGETVKVTVPDAGIPVDTLVEVTATTPESVGSADTVNIGIGGGFYISATLLNNEGEAVVTNNIVDRAYFANPPARAKALSLLGVDPSIKIRSESLENQHEYYVGDAGPSAIRPLYLGLNLGSVSGQPTENVLIENYSATYSLIEDESQLAEHFNNNALSIPVVAINYQDPLYRYILDTSTLTAVLNDFTLVGFRDKAFTEIDSKFIRNIPFGFIVVPSTGSRYNPFNGHSNLISYGTKHVRELTVNANLSPTIDGFEVTPHETYNLYNEDGSKRIGLVEPEGFENFGFKYDPTIFTQTFYNGEEYTTSSQPASSFGTSYLVRDVLDYLQTTYDPSALTWYDIFSRMPVSQMGRVFYENTNNFLEELANGYRNSIPIDYVESGYLGTQRVLADDDKTIITKTDRSNVTTFKK